MRGNYVASGESKISITKETIMTPNDRELFFNFVATCAIIIAYSINIIFKKIYHGNFIFSIIEFLPIIFGTFITIMHFFDFKLHRLFSRMLTWSIFIVVLLILYYKNVRQLMGYSHLLFSLTLIIGFGSYLVIKSKYYLWVKLRRVMGILPSLLILPPIIVGQLIAEPKLWLGPPNSNQATPVSTIVLLFDELNAKSSNGLQKVLTERGLNVEFKTLIPIHNSTIEVIPALFTEQNFIAAQVCGYSRVCGDGVALDFSKVYVERNDVDIVGFYHPYCSIQGLRSCYRSSSNRSVWDYDRLVCFAKNRLGLNLNRDDKLCQLIGKQSWLTMGKNVSDELLNTPVFKQGGVLYAHIPLPHPPSEGTGSLATQYKRNVAKSEELLGQILDKLAINKIEPRILIFSDHPLRPNLWCANEFVSFDSPCEITPELIDSYVTLILASHGELPQLNNIESNIKTFGILREWLSH